MARKNIRWSIPIVITIGALIFSQWNYIASRSSLFILNRYWISYVTHGKYSSRINFSVILARSTDIEYIINYLSGSPSASPNAIERWVTIYLLKEVDPSKAINVFRKGIKDEFPEVRCFSALALGQTGEIENVKLLESMLEDNNKGMWTFPVKYYAIDSIERIVGKDFGFSIENIGKGSINGIDAEESFRSAISLYNTWQDRRRGGQGEPPKTR